MSANVFDTETSGMPEWKIPSDDPAQPHIVQIAAIVFDPDDSFAKERELNLIVKPDGWEWDENCPAYQTHGITVERAMDEGVSEKDALDAFMDLHKGCDYRVAHNATFDNRIIRIALKRYYGDAEADLWKSQVYHCTMLRAKPIMKLPPLGRYGYKSPKLAEAVEFFTGLKLENAHDALADATACLEVWKGILGWEATHDIVEENRKVGKEPKQHMTLESLFEFGKHKGSQLEDVIVDSPSYITWCISEGVVTFDDEAMEKITKNGIV